MTKTEDLKACCAHLTLRYRTRPVDDMCITGYWYCEDCCNEFNIARPTVTPTDTAMEDAAQREPAEMVETLKEVTSPRLEGTSSTTDGDAERALEAVQAWFDSIEWREETGKPFKYKDSEEVLYKHGETIRTALQTRRAFRTEDASDEDIAAVETAKYGKHPVDTIPVPREVLQGVREALVTARLLAIMHFNFKSETEQTFEKCLASLDAVFAEGE